MQKINKPWGYEEIWAITEFYVGKKLVIFDKRRLSKQFHVKKTETIYVQKGILTLGLLDREIKLCEGQQFHIEAGTIHRFSANEGDVILFEVSTPELEDVVRLEDDYNRIA